jgi:hypothetical protein
LILDLTRWEIISKGCSDGAPKSVVAMTFIYKVNGVDTEFSEDDLMNLPKVPNLSIEKIK